MQGVQGIEHLRAPAPKDQMQGMQGIEHLRAPAHQEQMQGMQGIEHLRAPAHQECMQGMQGIERLRAPARKEQVQGVQGIEHPKRQGSLFEITVTLFLNLRGFTFWRLSGNFIAAQRPDNQRSTFAIDCPYQGVGVGQECQ